MKESVFSYIPLFSGRQSLPEYCCGNSAFMRVYDCKAKADLDEYVGTLLKNGFELYSQSSVGTVSAVTLTGTGMLLHLYYISAKNELRVVADTETALFPAEPQAVENKVQTVVYQFEVGHSLIDCGMCYVIRCCDNSFFVIDSAHALSLGDDKRLHGFLRSLVPEGEKIIINGWLLTHNHDDHVIQFLNFVEDDWQDVEIRYVYRNFIDPDIPDNYNWNLTDKRRLDELDGILAARPHIKVVRPHTGERFYAANLTVDVLCTHEDVYPGEFKDFNDTSTVVMISAEGEKLLFLADAFKQESDVLEAYYDGCLSCTVMQVAHHAHSGVTRKLYELARAKVAFFPTTKIFFEADLERYADINGKVLELCDSCYVASDGTVGIPLPYKKGEAIIYADETFENFTAINKLWGYAYTDERKRQLLNDYLAKGGSTTAVADSADILASTEVQNYLSDNT